MIRNFTSFIILFLLISGFQNISNAQALKQEMRSTWLTTVWGLDWPKTKIPAGGGDYYIELQKQQLIRLLDSVKVANMNAVFFQIRPEADAFYNSSYEPWSAHLVESRGQDPGYDPLQFAIEESHKRGLELHAWINPYRFESTAGKYSGQEGDYRQTHPEWVLTYSGGGAILDPGNPGVRERIENIVEEIVQNYDLDGIIFDDYFYAYGGTPATLDQYSQDNWKPASMDLHDWRRDNINKMVAGVYQTIKANKPWVRFGVSPFGIWTMDPQVAASYGLTLPSGITGMDAYKSIYADPVAWLSQGTVDYVSPQIYWPTTSAGQDYKKLAPWWSDVANKYNRHLYVSHSLTNLDESDYPPPVALKSAYSDFLQTDLKGMSMLEYFSQLSAKKSAVAFDASEIGLQIYWNRISDHNQAPGSVFFRATNLFTRGFINYLRSNEYAYKALPPNIPWKEKQERTLPSNLRIENEALTWESQEENVRYAIYAFPEILPIQPGLFSDATYLLGLTYTTTFDLPAIPYLSDDHLFAVAVVDRNGNEFPPVIMGMDVQENQPVTLISPADKGNVFQGFAFRWNEVEGAEYYFLEVSTDSSFTSVVNRRNVYDTSYYSDALTLNEDSAYYWRVITRMANATDTASLVRSFVVQPLPRPEIIYPLNEMTDIEVTPVIEWESFDNNFTMRMQISSNSLFTDIVFEETGIEGDSLKLSPGTIFPYSTYYLRLQAMADDSVTLWSETVQFSTVTTPPSVPVIIAPSEGEAVSGPQVTISVQEQPLAKSITFQLSNSESFPWNNRFQYSTDAPDYSLVLDDLSEGTWYVKARANYGTASYTDWSEVLSFSLLTTGSPVLPENQFAILQPVFTAPGVLQIRYSLNLNSKVKFYITGITGKTIWISRQEVKSKGMHSLEYNCSGLPPGIYMVTLETSYGRKTVKMIRQ